MVKKKIETSVLKNTGDSIADVSQRKLYIRFPHRVPPLEEVMQLSPAITSVNYPRQKSIRFCHIILESPAAVPEVLKLLNKKKYNNGHLIVEMPRKLQYKHTDQALNVSVDTDQIEEKEEKGITMQKTNEIKHSGQNKFPTSSRSERKGEPSSGGKYVLKKRKVKLATGGDNDRRLWMKKLPSSTNEKELMAAFPGCIWARVYKRKGCKASRAICKFSTAQQAASILADHKKHTFKGQVIMVEVAKSQQLRGFGDGKRSIQKYSNQTSDSSSQQILKKGQVESNFENSEETVCSDNEVMDIEETDTINGESSDLSVNADDDDNDDDDDDDDDASVDASD